MICRRTNEAWTALDWLPPHSGNPHHPQVGCTYKRLCCQLFAETAAILPPLSEKWHLQYVETSSAGKTGIRTLMSSLVMLRSEIPSGMCAKLHTVAASNNRDHARNLSYYCLLVLHIQWCYSSRTSRSWWITQSTQHHQRGCNSNIWYTVTLTGDCFAIVPGKQGIARAMLTLMFRGIPLTFQVSLRHRTSQLVANLSQFRELFHGEEVIFGSGDVYQFFRVVVADPHGQYRYVVRLRDFGFSPGNPVA